MLIGDMTAVKYELNCNCLFQSVMKSGLRDVVRRRPLPLRNATQKAYIGLHATDNSKHQVGQKSLSLDDKFSSLGDIYVTQL